MPDVLPLSVTSNASPAVTGSVGTVRAVAATGALRTSHSTMPTHPVGGFVSVARSAVVVTGACVTVSNWPTVVVYGEASETAPT